MNIINGTILTCLVIFNGVDLLWIQMFRYTLFFNIHLCSKDILVRDKVMSIQFMFWLQSCSKFSNNIWITCPLWNISHSAVDKICLETYSTYESWLLCNIVAVVEHPCEFASWSVDKFLHSRKKIELRLLGGNPELVISPLLDLR